MAKEEPDYYDLYDAQEISYQELLKFTEDGKIDYWLLTDMYKDDLIDYPQFVELLKSRKIYYDDLAAMLEEGYIEQAFLEKLVNEDIVESDKLARAVKEIGLEPLQASNLPGRLQTQDTLESNNDREMTGSIPGEEPDFLSEYWIQLWALVLGAIGVILAVTGFSFANRKKRKSVSRFINEIDDTFESFKWKSKRCEAELYRLHDVVDEKLKEGKIDEAAYNLLIDRINKYMKEVQEVHDPVREQTKKK